MSNNIMIFELDSINQIGFADSFPSKNDAVREITGMVRSALVFSGELLVTDAMLLDGWYFQEIGPKGLASELGVSVYNLPLRVIGVAGSLKDSLAQKLSNESFVWQTNLGTDKVWPTQETAATWKDWCEAAERGYFKYSDGVRGKLPEELTTRTDPRECFDGYHAEILELAIAHEFSVDRSNFYTEFESSKASIAEPSSSHQHHQLYTWWNAAYLQMIAEQNGANWISFSRSHAPRRVMGFKSGQSFKVSKMFLARMKNLNPGAFGTVASAIQEPQKIFMKKPTTSNLRGLVFASMGCLEAPKRGQVLRSSIIRALLALAVIVISLPAIDFSGLGLTTTWIVFGVMAVATAPWGELNNLRQLLDTSDTIELMMVGERAY